MLSRPSIDGKLGRGHLALGLSEHCRSHGDEWRCAGFVGGLVEELRSEAAYCCSLAPRAKAAKKWGGEKGDIRH